MTDLRAGLLNSRDDLSAIDRPVYTHAGFNDSSALLGHELAYVLGQINDEHALPVLESVLRDDNQHPMVRHEVSRPAECSTFTPQERI